MAKKTKMTQEAARRIQRAAAKKDGGQVKKGTFPPRVQSVVDKRAARKGGE